MNLTSKRMLKGLAVCVSACALSATAATTWVADSFEDGEEGQAIYTYKADPYASGQQTNFLWEAQEGDASKLAATTDQTGYELIRPITNTTANLHLKLETEGTTLVRYLNLAAVPEPVIEGEKEPVAVPFNTANGVYIDTMIKFTPSEDDPEINDENVKVAVFVNVNSNLVVYHMANDGGNFISTNSVFAETIDPEAWYRLTIQMGMNGSLSSCQVFLNQNALQHQNAFTAGAEPEPNGTWFLLQGTGNDVTQVSFQGTGALDEFVVADEVDIAGQAAIMLTLTWAEADDAKISVVQGETSVARGDSITNGVVKLQIVKDWYQINSVDGTNITYTGRTGDNTQDSSGTITADGPDCTATITIGTLTGSVETGMPGDYATMNLADLAAWAMGNSPALTQEDVMQNAAAYLDDFLLNVDAGTDATISISSIEITGTVATITVTASETVNFGGLNGTLVVLATDDLSAAFVEVGSGDFTITEASATATIEVNVSAGQFIKAKVK